MLWGHDDTSMLYHHTVSNFIFLGAGALIAYLQVNEHKSLKSFTTISKLQWTSFFSIFVLLLIFTKEPLFSFDYGAIIYFILSASFLSFLLLNQTYKVKRSFELSNIPSLIPMAKYTYGLYMYHRIAGFILSTMIFKVMKLDHTIYIDFTVVLLQFCLAFFLAYISYRYMEQPILKYKNRFSIFHK
jgi:peptidoglycan/LPS O-acetylase OafA/YrhL